MKNNKLLIIGKCPLPIGGVTIHVQRLLDWLDHSNVNYEYYDLKRFKFFSFCSAIRRNDYAHLHSSSPVLRLVFAVICSMSHTKALITYHGNIGRFGFVKNKLDALSVRLAYLPIVLNQGSLCIARKYNHKVILSSAYIPEVNAGKNTLSEDTLNAISRLRQSNKVIACTNAYNLSFDKNGNEIYGISFLVSCFRNSGNALIISDPSGNYRKKIKTEYDNILFIAYPHSFIEVLKFSDCFIRYTSTDGDSLSIHEALDCNIPVIATDIVSRPDGVILVQLNDEVDLQSKLSQITCCKNNDMGVSEQTKKIPDVVKIYNSLIA